MREEPVEQPLDADETAVVPDPILLRLRSIAAAKDAVPAHVVAAARAAFLVRDLDAELAELVLDSADQPADLALVRDGGEVRMLAFQAGELGLELEVSAVGERRRLVGQLVGGAVTEVLVQSARGSSTVPVDELGRFLLDAVERGPVRFRAVLPAGRAVATSWISV